MPPEPGRVLPLVDDLCRYVSGDAHSSVLQAAVAHAQFETIHPFADGNGRVGRALIHVVLRRRRLARRVLAPVSLVLATRASDYVAGLQAFRYDGDADDPRALEQLAGYVEVFADATRRACADAAAFAERLRGLEQSWRSRVGRVRRGSSTDLLLTALAGIPVVTVAAVAQVLGRSRQAANDAVGALQTAGVLVPLSSVSRNRVFEPLGLLDAFTGLERSLASPTGDTRESPPVRLVPARPP